MLDRAYYAEMLSAARATGSGFLVEYVQGTIDAANLRSAVRTLRMKKGADLLKKVLVEGGAIRPESVQAAALAGNLEELYRPTPCVLRRSWARRPPRAAVSPPLRRPATMR